MLPLLYVATVPVKARVEKSKDSDPLGTLSSGSLLRCNEMDDAEKRMNVTLEGATEPFGWISHVSKDGTETVKLSALDMPLVLAGKSFNRHPYFQQV